MRLSFKVRRSPKQPSVQCGCGRNYETTYQPRKHSLREIASPTPCTAGLRGNRQDRAPTEVVKSGRVRTRGCSAPKSAWYWQATPEHEALWSYLDLCGSTWSVAGTLCLVDTGYKPRRDSSSIYASGVAATGGHIPWESRSLLVPIHAQDPPMVVLGPF